MPFTKHALDYHLGPPAGKLGIALTKPCDSQQDLTLAYSPGVAAPCLAIRDDRTHVYRYTNRSNLVAVVTNGTAVLGLGNIGPEAAKPVMEGKAMLFKRLADLDAFDIELAARQRESSWIRPSGGSLHSSASRTPCHARLFRPPGG